MKTKLSKKLLSAFLAIIMVVTSIPLMGFSVFAAEVAAADDTNVVNAKAAMQELHTKLAEENKMFIDVLPAYEAYVKVQAAIDGYQYGTLSASALNGYVNTLRSKISAIGEFTGFTANQTGSYASDATYLDDYYYHQTYNSLLYAETKVNTAWQNNSYPGAKSYYDHSNYENANKSFVGAYSAIFYPTVTMLYTGDPGNTPRTTVAMHANGSKEKRNKDRYLYASILRSNVSGLELADDWKQDANFDVQWALCDNSAARKVGHDTSSQYKYRLSDTSKAISGNRTVYPINLSNSIVYNGDGTDANGKIQPVLTAEMFFDICIGSSGTAVSFDDIVETHDLSSFPIVIINYNYLKEQIKNSGQMMKSVALENYSEGGLMEYMTAMDVATKWNPNDYFNTGSKTNGNANNYTKCAEDMVLVAGDLKLVTPDPTTEDGQAELSYLSNSANFAKLRKAMSDRKSDYNNGIRNPKFEETSFNGFLSLYKQAESIMSSLITTGYDESQIHDNAGNLIDIADLADQIANYTIEVNTVLTEVSTLTHAIDEFEGYDNIFTAETYNNVRAIVNEAKKNVWPSEETPETGDYKSLACQLEIEEDYLDNKQNSPNQRMVNNYASRINAAITNLRIDPNAKIMTTDGLYSLNQACDLINNLPGGLSPEDLAGYGVFELAVTEVTEDGGYRSKLPSTPFMDYETQYNEYKAAVQKIITAYLDMAPSLMLIKNGEIAKEPNAVVENYIDYQTRPDAGWGQNKKTFRLGFNISDNQAVVLRTTHDAAVIPYGDAYVTFGSSVDSADRNNFLDSFTLNATAESNGDFQAKSGDSPNSFDAISDETYKPYNGLLSYGGIKLTNFEVSDKNYINTLSYYAKATDGTVLDQKSYLPDHDYYTEILATAEGRAEKQPGGGLYARSNDSSKFGTVTLRGTANLELAADPQDELRVSDLNATLTKEQILAAYPNNGQIVGTTRINVAANYGATIRWNYATFGATNWAGFAFINSSSNSIETMKTYETGATVVDLADYFDFVKFCDRFSALGGEIYDQDQWRTFQTALSNAKDYSYKNKTAEQITLGLNPKYSALYTALEALTLRTYTVNFITKDSQGNNVDNIITLNYGEKLSNYIDQINAIDTKTTYSADFCTWTCNDTWTLDADWKFPVDIDVNAVVKSNAVYYAVYESTPNLANFDAFNTAKRAVLSLPDYTYTVAALQDLASKISAMTYFSYTAEQQAETSEQYQSAIDAETRALNVYLNPNTLKPVSLSGEAYDLAATAAQMRINAAGDSDQYNLVPDFSYYEEVNVGGAVIKAVTFTTEAELNAAVNNFLNDLNSNIRTYNIYLNDEKINADPIPYGSTVVVDSDKTVSIVTPDEITNNKEGAALVNWSYGYDAPSRNGAGATDPKYMTTSTSFGFIVKGDAYLTTTPATQDETNFLVTVKASTGNVIDICSTTGAYTMPNSLPSYAYYTVDAANPFSNGAQLGETITVTEDTTIIVNYVPAESQYQIDVFASLDDWMNMTNMISEYANYNEKVQLSADDAYCWVAAIYDMDLEISYYTVLFYGSSYNFYAYREFLNDENGEAIVALSKADYDSLVSGQTKLENQYLSDVYFDENAYDVIVDGEGNPILGVAVEGRGGVWSVSPVAPAPAPTVSILTDPVVVTKEGSLATKFSLVASFSLPEGYSMVESGYLFTKNIDLDAGAMTVENSGLDKDITRMKSSKYTVGNQFVVNYNTAKTFDFKYRAYSIIKNDATGEINTYYSKVSGDFNNAAL